MKNFLKIFYPLYNATQMHVKWMLVGEKERMKENEKENENEHICNICEIKFPNGNT